MDIPSLSKEQFINDCKNFYAPFLQNQPNRVKDLYWVILNGIIDVIYLDENAHYPAMVYTVCRTAMLSLNTITDNIGS